MVHGFNFFLFYCRMTCFWTGVVSALTHEDLVLLGNPPTNNLPAFIRRLQELAPTAEFNIRWQSAALTEKEIQEQKEAIRDYNISNIGQGHWTSACDPFLCLLADVLQVKIDFMYMNHMIVFESTKTPRKTLQFAASNSHFVQTG
jgi:hypothetical protein